jgi:phosphatidate cytidylyltransferase
VLKQRIITALVLVPLVLGAVFYLPNLIFSYVIALVLLLGAWEWANLMGWEDTPKRAAYVVSCAVLMVLVQLGGVTSLPLWSLPWWFAATYLVIKYPQYHQLWAHKRVLAIIGFMVLLPAWQGLVQLQARVNGPWYVMFVMLLVWGADTGAYFAGRRWGRRKLAPRVSPGKSIAGLVGGLLTTALIAIVVGAWQGFTPLGWTQFLLLTLCTVLASVIGDLTESMFKRERGIKDSGSLLPGHGGVLDRIDSMTAAVPVFAAGLLMSGHL